MATKKSPPSTDPDHRVNPQGRTVAMSSHPRATPRSAHCEACDGTVGHRHYLCGPGLIPRHRGGLRRRRLGGVARRQAPMPTGGWGCSRIERLVTPQAGMPTDAWNMPIPDWVRDGRALGIHSEGIPATAGEDGLRRRRLAGEEGLRKEVRRSDAHRTPGTTPRGRSAPRPRPRHGCWRQSRRRRGCLSCAGQW
jgi:hypothetical protein